MVLNIGPITVDFASRKFMSPKACAAWDVPAFKFSVHTFHESTTRYAVLTLLGTQTYAWINR